jgi:hypothetical protein
LNLFEDHDLRSFKITSIPIKPLLNKPSGLFKRSHCAFLKDVLDLQVKAINLVGKIYCLLNDLLNGKVIGIFSKMVITHFQKIHPTNHHANMKEHLLITPIEYHDNLKDPHSNVPKKPLGQFKITTFENP